MYWYRAKFLFPSDICSDSRHLVLVCVWLTRGFRRRGRPVSRDGMAVSEAHFSNAAQEQHSRSLHYTPGCQRSNIQKQRTHLQSSRRVARTGSLLGAVCCAGHCALQVFHACRRTLSPVQPSQKGFRAVRARKRGCRRRRCELMSRCGDPVRQCDAGLTYLTRLPYAKSLAGKCQKRRTSADSNGHAAEAGSVLRAVVCVAAVAFPAASCGPWRRYRALLG